MILVLKGLSLEVPDGKIVALLGSNGAGKSHHAEGHLRAAPREEGEVTDGAIELRRGSGSTSSPPEAIVRRGIFQVMEGRRVFEDLTVDENIDDGRATPGTTGPACGATTRWCFEYFPRLRERRKKLAGYLSGGEQQMLAISRALMARPKLILLDEPSLGLAPLLVREIFEIIKRINEEEKTTLPARRAERQPGALGIADYGYIMENGRIVLDGEPDKLRANEDVKEFYLGGGGGRRRATRTSSSTSGASAGCRARPRRRRRRKEPLMADLRPGGAPRPARSRRCPPAERRAPARRAARRHRGATPSRARPRARRTLEAAGRRPGRRARPRRPRPHPGHAQGRPARGCRPRSRPSAASPASPVGAARAHLHVARAHLRPAGRRRRTSGASATALAAAGFRARRRGARLRLLPPHPARLHARRRARARSAA